MPIQYAGDYNAWITDEYPPRNGATARQYSTGALDRWITDRLWLDDWGEGIVGALTETLADVTLAGAGDLPIVGALAETLDDVTLAGAGDLAIVGTLAETLDDVTLSGAVDLPIVGGLAETLDEVTLTGSGALTIVGSLVKTLDPVTLDANGYPYWSLACAVATVEVICH